MSNYCSQHLGTIFTQPKIYCWDSKSRHYPYIKHHRYYFFKEGHAKNSVSVSNYEEQTNKPSERNDDEAINERLSDQSRDKLLHSFHFLVLLFGKEDGLCDIFNVQVSRMLMVMIMPIPPCIEGKVIVDAEYFAKENVQFDRFEEGEVSHVMELKKISHVQEGLTGPTNKSETKFDQHNYDQLHSE